MPGALFVGCWGWSLEVGSGLIRVILQGSRAEEGADLPIHKVVVHFGHPQALAFDTLMSMSTWALTAASQCSWAWALQKEEGATGHSQHLPVFTVSLN